MSGKILIVEDDHSISSMIYDYLASENFSADIFSNGTGAVRAFSASPDYALALIDLMLPDISGVEVIRSIRQTSTSARYMYWLYVIPFYPWGSIPGPMTMS